MRSIAGLIRLALFTLPILASEDLLPVKRAEGEVLENSYVVILKGGPSAAGVDSIAKSMPNSTITNQWSIVPGFAANLTEGDLDMLRARNDVLSISENAVVKHTATQ